MKDQHFGHKPFEKKSFYSKGKLYFGKQAIWAQKRKQAKEDMIKAKGQILKNKFNKIIQSNEKIKEKQPDAQNLENPLENPQNCNLDSSSESDDGVLKDIIVTPSEEMGAKITEEANPSEIPEENEKKVTNILGRKVLSRDLRNTYYLVQWEGSRMHEAKWEHVSSLEHVIPQLLEFEERFTKFQAERMEKQKTREESLKTGGNFNKLLL